MGKGIIAHPMRCPDCNAHLRGICEYCFDGANWGCRTCGAVGKLAATLALTHRAMSRRARDIDAEPLPLEVRRAIMALMSRGQVRQMD
jgi:hypothetical protein